MPTYTPLQSVQLASSSANVTFSNIPQTYQDLVIVLSVRGTTATNDIDVSAIFNSDSSSIYSNTRLYGDGSSVGPQRGTGLAYARLGNMTGSGSYATYTPIIFHILNYSNTSVLKSTIGRSNNPNRIIDLYANLWRSTSAITSIQITAGTNFDVGSTFDLYGISPVAANNAQAAGGTDIFYDASYVYHVFKGSGTFTPYRNLTADVLVVAAGGGGGGGFNVVSAMGGGGGGAGGLLAYTSQSLTSGTSYAVTVGAGGVNGTYSGQGGGVGGSSGGVGSNSQFGSLTAASGGGGGAGRFTAPSNGGSGGGGASDNGFTYGTGTAGQGNDGGQAYGSGTSRAGAGGGGNAAVGGRPPSSTAGGVGGGGSSTYSSWGSATGTGQLVSSTYYYAGGGGGGGGFSSGTGGSGGNGGGGAGGASASNGNSGITNTGGGGGGGEGAESSSGTSGNGGAGGSGIVIVRYAR